MCCYYNVYIIEPTYRYYNIVFCSYNVFDYLLTRDRRPPHVCIIIVYSRIIYGVRKKQFTKYYEIIYQTHISIAAAPAPFKKQLRDRRQTFSHM